MPTKLTYTLTTEPFPLLANTSATLTVVASNPTPKTPCTIVGVSITLPIGHNASDLSAAEASRVEAPGEKWDVADKPSEGAIEYVFTPPDGEVVIDEHGLAFVFVISVNPEPGTATIRIREGIKGAPTNTGTLTVSKFPQRWGQVDFAVKPANIKAGESTQLSWLGPEGATYTIDYFVPGTEEPVHVPAPDKPALSNDGKYPGETDPPLTLEATTTFTLTVIMTLGARRYEAQQQKVVTVKPRPPVPPSIKYFRPRGCTESECVIYADSFVLEWDFDNATPGQCQLTEADLTPSHNPTRIIPLIWAEKFAIVRPSTTKMRYTMTIDNKPEPITSTVTATLIPPVPVGTIVPFGGKSVAPLPAGWLYCNGSEYSPTEYPQLYAVIGDLYSKAAGKSLLPDLRGLFVRGYNDNATIDPGRTMGSYQADAFGKHAHRQKVTANVGAGKGLLRDLAEKQVTLGEYDQGVDTYDTGDSETRPKNLACFYIIYAGPSKPPGDESDEDAEKTTTDS